MPGLFSQQQQNSDSKNHIWPDAVVVAFVTVPKRIGTNKERDGDHHVLKRLIINDVGTKYRQAAQHQWQHSAMNGTSNGCSNPQGVPINLKPHQSAKILRCNFVAKCFSPVGYHPTGEPLNFSGGVVVVLCYRSGITRPVVFRNFAE